MNNIMERVWGYSLNAPQTQCLKVLTDSSGTNPTLADFCGCQNLVSKTYGPLTHLAGGEITFEFIENVTLFISLTRAPMPLVAFVVNDGAISPRFLAGQIQLFLFQILGVDNRRTAQVGPTQVHILKVYFKQPRLAQVRIMQNRRIHFHSAQKSPAQFCIAQFCIIKIYIIQEKSFHGNSVFGQKFHHSTNAMISIGLCFYCRKTFNLGYELGVSGCTIFCTVFQIVNKSEDSNQCERCADYTQCSGFIPKPYYPSRGIFKEQTPPQPLGKLVSDITQFRRFNISHA